MALNWKDKQDGVDFITADDVNSLAHAIEDLEENGGGGGGSTVTDDKMSDTSTNAVQNKVIKAYVDNAITSAIIDSWEVDL